MFNSWLVRSRLVLVKGSLLCGGLFVAASLALQATQPTTASLYRAPAVPAVVDDVVFEAGNWTPHLEAGAKGDSLGNHRAVVELTEAQASAGQPVRVTIPWRRRDPKPETKAVVVVNAATGAPLTRVATLSVSNMSGEVVFEPQGGARRYFVYYLPWQSGGGYYPKISYRQTVVEPDTAWIGQITSKTDGFTRVRASRIQSVDAFHSFFPMEVIASPAETAAFMKGAEDGWRVVAEHRDYSVRMRNFLPYHWTTRAPVTTLTSQVLRDEFFTFQVVVVAGERAREDVRVSFEGFPATWQRTLTCFNCGGINENGQPFTKTINVPAGEVQPIWIGVMVPADQRPGPVQGTVVVRSGSSTKRVSLALTVNAAQAVNHGYDEPELQSRLAWLNSTAGTDGDFIIPPFTPVESTGQGGRTLGILGRRITLGSSGLPARIESFFTPELTTLAPAATPVIASPIALEPIVNGTAVAFTEGPWAVQREARGRVSWTAERTSPSLAMTVRGALEYDGMIDYQITLRATRDVSVDDVRMPVRMAPDAADYMLGLGRKGGRRPERVDWTWKVENHQEGVWLGAVNKGLQYVLRDDRYLRPLNTNFYQNQPLRMPVSWENGGKGGIRIETLPDAVVATNYSGARTMKAGETLAFHVRFLVTPFKPINTEAHFNTRFVHKYVPVDEVIAAGGTVVNVHHANEINPYINYPFFNLDKQTAYIKEAHSKGIKVKLYNTIRELTYKAHELFALRSLGDEIFNDGEGGGHSWLQEHLVDRYHSAWHAYSVDDAAILDKGTSRRTNYYIEGLAWLADHQQIDGLYLDDIAFSRETVRRMISVLHARRPEVVIDLHSANQFNPRDGHINSAMLYMEHFPYMSRLWFGEYFEYQQPDDYWMTEVSGLPFGLMGEMLEGGGHPYRGMLYGMTSRFYGKTDPRPVWKMMNDFGIAQSRMKGYWLADTPVKTGRPDVLATTYVRGDQILIALASWAKEDVQVALNLNLSALGVTGPLQWSAPAVEGLQTGGVVNPAAVVVPAGQGLFVIGRK